MRTDPRTPVLILTGFLGSGKTTLLKQVLSQPELSNSMVIVNEFGEVGIDHQLLDSSDDKTVLLDNGCMCCELRGDLQELLLDLDMRRRAGSLPSFDRVIIETSGLAEPGPIAQTLYSDGPLAREFRLAHTIVLVDPLHGELRAAAPNIAESQISHADLLIISKADLVSAPQIEAAKTWAKTINAYADCISVAHGKFDLARLIDAHPYQSPSFRRAGQGLFGRFLDQPEPDQSTTSEPRVAGAYLQRQMSLHPSSVSSFTLTLPASLDYDTFTLFLNTLIRARGSDLLRVKGLVYFDGKPGVHLIQGVRHVFDKPLALDQNVSVQSLESTLVFIVQNMEKSEVEKLWEAIEVLMQKTNY